MKRYFLFKFFLILMAMKIMGQSSTNHEEDKAKMATLVQQARQGDTNALMGAVSLDPSVSVPTLGAIALNRSTSSEMATAASLALAQIPNVEAYIGDQIQKFSTQNTAEAAFSRAKAFDILAQIHTEKAVSTIADFLFDDTTMEYNGGDFIVESNKLAALITLTRMHLSDGPTNDKSLLPYADQITAWRKWAIAKSFAPGQANVEPAFTNTQTNSTPAEAEHETQHASAISATPEAPEPVKVGAYAARENPREIVWPIAILVIVIASGVYFMHKRQKP